MVHDPACPAAHDDAAVAGPCGMCAVIAQVRAEQDRKGANSAAWARGYAAGRRDAAADLQAQHGAVSAALREHQYGPSAPEDEADCCADLVLDLLLPAVRGTAPD